MESLFGYALQDMLMFSPETYWRLFEVENRATMPVPLLLMAVFALAPFFFITPRPVMIRVCISLMAIGCAWSGWRFLVLSYQPILPVAGWFVPLFGLQACLLFWLGGLCGFARQGSTKQTRGAIGLTLIGVAGWAYPAMANMTGIDRWRTEFPGVAPDPTMIGVLGAVLLCFQGRPVWVLLPIPLIWCGFSALTLYAMGAWQAVLPAAAIAATLYAVASDKPGA